MLSLFFAFVLFFASEGFVRPAAREKSASGSRRGDSQGSRRRGGQGCHTGLAPPPGSAGGGAMAELVPRGFAQGRVAVRVACALPGGRSYEEWVNWELPAGGAVSANQLQREANAFVQQLAKDGAVPASEVVGIAKDIGQQLRAAANKMSSGGTGAVVGAEELYLMRADVALPGESGGPGRAAEDDKERNAIGDQFVWDATGPHADLDAFAAVTCEEAGLPRVAAASLAAELRSEALEARRLAGSDPSLLAYAPKVSGRGATRRGQVAQAEATEKGSQRIAPLTLHEDMSTTGIIRAERDAVLWGPTIESLSGGAGDEDYD